MPYTSATLTTIYTNIHAGLAPSAAQQALLNAYAAQNNAGTLTDAQTLQAVIDTADGDSAVAIGSYQYFTGTSPSAAGLAFLVNSATNATDLNDAYYQNFNQTNRFINCAANLGTGAGAAAFKTAYGALTTSQTVDIAYETIIGTANAQAAGINVTNAKAYINSQLPYFQALANQNAPAGATAADKDLLIKAEIVGYIMSAAVAANVGTYSNAISSLLADLGPDNTANLGVDLIGNYASTVVTLTNGPDTKVANVFNAPRGFTPGGTDQVNTLNDDDNLTGVGTNPTLNFTFVNDADTGDYYIVPIMTNLQTINVAFAQDSNGTLDLEDSTGAKAVNITRISGSANSNSIINLTTIPTISITNSNAPSASVYVEFLQSTVAGAADATTLTLSNANMANLFIEQTGQGAGLTDGIETLTIVSNGSANKIGTLEAEDLKSLIITGGQKLTLGSTATDVNGGIPGLIEATRYGNGLANVAGSLTSIDASAMTASLDLTLGTEANTTVDDTSGTPLLLSVKGGSANDTFRLSAGVNPAVGATIDGGGGVNTLSVYSSTNTITLTKGSYTNIQNLDVRSGQDDGAAADAATVDTSLFPALASITVRNEGMTLTGSPIVGQWTSVAENATFTLNKLSVAAAAGITALHGTTNNNAITSTVINATLATDTASDLVGLTIKDGVNNDPRSNFTLTAGTAPLGTNVVENITINDSDSESNAVRLTNYLAHTGTITLTGGQVGNYLDLDTTQFAGVNNFAGGNQKDVSGAAVDGKGWHDFGAGAGDQIIASTISAGSFVGDVILRVGNPAGAAGAQSITTGSGNDTIIFDVVTGIGNTTAGLSISDTVAAGAGTDTLVIDGNATKINISASEWTNVTGFENLRLVGVGAVAGGTTNDLYGNNGYNVTLTNNFITANNTTTGGISRIAIINDNDPTNDATGVSTATDTSPNSGATIDARQLDATHSFSYNGEEGAGATADRFIMSDANINGAAIIDGGYGAFGGHAINADVLEVRDAAVVTIGDLANIKNVGTLAFTNDTAAVQNSTLQLDTATIDALVNSSAAAGTFVAGTGETLAITVQGNTLIPGATTNLTIDAAGVDFSKVNFNVTTLGGASITILNATNNFTFNGTAGPDAFAGSGGNDIINGGGGNDTLSGGEGSDIITGGTGADQINLTETVSSPDQVRFAPGDGSNSVLTGFFTGSDTVTGFNAANDTIRVDGSGVSVVLNATPAPQVAGTTFTNVPTATFDANGAIGGAFITGATAADLTSGFDAAVAISTVNNETVGESAYFAVMNTAGTQVGIYHFVSVTADNAIFSNELELLGVVNIASGTVTAANFLFF